MPRISVTPDNNLARCFPELLKEYDFKRNPDPAVIYCFSTFRVWWHCLKCSHDWQTQVYRRTKLKRGCPACVHQVVTSTNNLAVTHPQLAQEFSERNAPLTPKDITAGTEKKLWWRCSKCGWQWRARGAERVAGYGCPACSGRVATPKNNLAVTHPHLVEEWSSRNQNPPAAYKGFSNKKAWWICRYCGHEWQAVIASRASGKGCPACAHQVLVPRNSLAALHPELAQEYVSDNPLPATKIFSRSRLRVFWRCSVCGHRWRRMVFVRVDGSRCPQCQNGRGKFAALYPQLVGEYSRVLNDLPPQRLIIKNGHDPIIWWECQSGHYWQSRLSARLSRYDIGCPECDKNRQKEEKIAGFSRRKDRKEFRQQNNPRTK